MSERTADLGALLNQLYEEDDKVKRYKLKEQAFDLLEEIEIKELGEMH